MKENSFYHDFSSELVRANRERNAMWYGIDKMVRLEYDLPGAVTKIDGIHKVTRPDPYVDIRTATNAMASAWPRIIIEPLLDDSTNRNAANRREQALGWWFRKLNNRRGKSVLKDIIDSAFRYSAIYLKTEYTPIVDAATRMATGEDVRSGHGPFIWDVRHPCNVHPIWSKRGLESVLSIEVKPMYQFVADWGDKGRAAYTKMQGRMDKASDQFRYVTEFCWHDMDVMYVWATPCATNAPSYATLLQDASTKGVEVYKVENDLGFIPWVCEENASALDYDTPDRFKPLLYYSWKSGSWYTQNVMETILMTQVIQNAGKPDWKHSGPNGDVYPSMHYDEITGGVMDVPVGHTMEETRDKRMDESLLTQAERLGGWMSQSGVSEALAGGGAAGEAYAAQNLRIITGQASISDGQELAERALSEGFIQMLRWITKSDMQVEARSIKRDTLGQIITLDPQTIDPDRTYITVELTAERPGSKIQAANTASIARSFGQSDYTALEMMGHADPEAELTRTFREQLVRAKIGDHIRLESAQVDVQIQQMMQQAQQVMQEQQAQIQQMQAMQPQGFGGGFSPPDMSQLPPTGAPDMGQGMNPAAGGIPFAQLNPEANTFEAQTGLTRTGDEAIL